MTWPWPGEDKLIRFGGVALGEACTIVLRGATQQILDEMERSLHDALCVLSQTTKTYKTVLGGGKNHYLIDALIIFMPFFQLSVCFFFIINAIIGCVLLPFFSLIWPLFCPWVKIRIFLLIRLEKSIGAYVHHVYM